MWVLDYKEGLVLKNWCFQTVVLEKTLESPLDIKEIKPINPKGNQLIIGELRGNSKGNPSLEGLMLNPKRQYFGHQIQRGKSLENNGFLIL